MNSAMNSALDPSKIIDLGFGFMRSQTLLAAVSMGLFTALGDEALTAAELGRRLDLHERGHADFFDGLVALGMLERDGDGADARYSNTPESGAFLDKRAPTYVGGILEMFHDRIFRFWADLDEGLRTGKPQNELKHDGRGMFEVLYEDPARLEQFMLAMQGVSYPNFAAFVGTFDFSPYKTHCDVGGANGLLASMVAKRHGHLQCATFDLPMVAPIAARRLESLGLQDRVKVLSGDFFDGPLPKADLITMGMILHDWNLENKMHLIRSAYEALPAGGAFVAIENLIDDARRVNVNGLMMSLNMLIEFGDAFDFTGADYGRWCREVGFKDVRIVHLNGPSSAAIAYK
jgi:hypothetical protein